MSIEWLKVLEGQKVTYNKSNGKSQQGIVKSFNDDGWPFIVYNCGGDWDNYKNYTAALTNPKKLTLGWDKK